jgi:hypothetical protein
MLAIITFFNDKHFGLVHIGHGGRGVLEANGAVGRKGVASSAKIPITHGTSFCILLSCDYAGQWINNL